VRALKAVCDGFDAEGLLSAGVPNVNEPASWVW